MKRQDRQLLILDAEIVCEYKTIQHNINDSLFFHNHDGYELLLVLDGEIDLYWDGDGRKLSRGDLVCIAPYVFHGALLRTPGCYDRICINIKESFLPLLSSRQTDFSPFFFGQAQGEPNRQHFSDGESDQFTSLSLQLQQALKRQAWGDDLFAKSLLTQLLLLVGRHSGIADVPKQPGIMPDLVARTFSYINSHLAEDISLGSLAAHIHHNAAYIGRCFKKITGTTVTQYIILKRVALAQQYLRKGHPLSDACYMAGFQNYSHFSRTFCAHVGVSPKQYQARFMARYPEYALPIP